MLGLTSLSQPPSPPPPPLAAPKFRHQNLSFFSSSLSISKSQKIPQNLKLLASNGDNNTSPDSKIGGGGGEREIGSDGGDEAKKDRRPILNVRWGDLLNPDPDNVIAVGLTGLLTWASVQVLGQLFLIAVAILVAALKYSFIAALLIFILITLL